MRFLVAPVLLTILLAGVLIPASASAQAPAGTRPVGRAVADFTLKDQYDSTFTLSAHRHVVVILVRATARALV